MTVYAVTKRVFSDHPYDDGEQLIGLAYDTLTCLGIIERDIGSTFGEHDELVIDNGPVLGWVIYQVRWYDSKQGREPWSQVQESWYVQEWEVQGAVA